MIDEPDKKRRFTN